MKIFFSLLIIFSANLIHCQSFTDFQFTGGGNKISNGQYTIFTRVSEELVGVTQNDRYILYIGSIYNFEKDLVTDVTGERELFPVEFKLFQNYPNPFNPITRIRYQIPSSGFVFLKIFDLLGREIITLVSEEKLQGSYDVIFDGKNLATGIYFYRIQTGNFIDTKKLLLIK